MYLQKRRYSFVEQYKKLYMFPEDSMFKLNSEEFKSILMSQKVTSSWGGTRKLPYAFTEQGVYMLMTAS